MVMGRRGEEESISKRGKRRAVDEPEPRGAGSGENVGGSHAEGQMMVAIPITMAQGAFCLVQLPYSVASPAELVQLGTA